MMLGRLFGKDKDAGDDAVCANCGRTLLAGEWTQKVVAADGREQVLCSLCGEAGELTNGERLTQTVAAKTGSAAGAGAEGVAPAVAAAATPPVKGENDALWKAIKDRDAQIERLNEQLARSEAERQELLGRLTLLQATDEAAEAPGDAAAAEPAMAAADEATLAPAPDAGEAESAETPAEPNTPELGGPAAEAAADEVEPKSLLEDTAEIAAADAPAEEADFAEDTSAAATPAQVPGTVSPDEPADDAAEPAADSLMLLQRGVDLLNVSPVPRKIAETNTDLGIPSVHVGFDRETAAVTFMWTMGWYRFDVDVESGAVRLGDRGYDERGDVQPNASVRADGTVQLAPARISRAAAQRQQEEQAVVEPPQAEAPQAPAEETPPATGGPEILSKSLLGQRTDDERPSWEGTQARDFDWDR
jgi:hypothetical protein